MTRSRTPRMARALRHPNYRLFFAGQSVSLVGTWITRIATSWLVYRLTKSAFLLGLVSFGGQIPTVLLTPFAGVLVDRWDRHRILVATQIASMIQSAILAALTFTNVIAVPHILVLQAIQGVINAFDTPARQAFVVHMVEDRQDLPNAIALNSTMVNSSRMLGPAIAGLIIAAVGEAWCFTIDAMSYLAVIASLLAMRVERVRAATGKTGVLGELRGGFEYVAASMPIRTSLILLAIISTMAMPYTVLMPAIAATILHGGPHTLGWLMTASGMGALLGAVYLTTRHSVVGLGRVTLVSTLTLGVGLVAFSLSHVFWLSLAILPLVGGGFMVQLAATNTILQTLVDEELRGRVMAFYTMAFFGGAPIGSLLAGVVGSRIGAPATIQLGGIVCLAVGVWYGLNLPRFRTLVRPIYIERGVISVPVLDAGAKTL